MIPGKCLKGFTSHLLHEIGGIFGRLLIMQGAIMKLNFLIWGIRCFSLQECPFLSSFQLVFLSDFRKNNFLHLAGAVHPAEW